ncbi:hemolysin family protein [Sandaracinus amylolyticus]|uniref:hemolysin family protein n=1 Tax=Sandaracinus amylolyticus TaxID=927083 RepID=UPI001F16767C|nr:hemolysin family protein [Sandaracinus amylolyticus]UJR80488.1 Magnesium and cobalt efflux protein CorC [Sandaracinus amylolyticus]
MLALLAALLCVLANAFFVAAEFALAKVRPTALQALANEGDPSAARAYAITQRLDAYLSATQLGITLASLGLGWLGEPAMERLLAPPLHALGVDEQTASGVAVTTGFMIISALHIVVGELVPKSLAIQRPEDVARHSSLLMRAFFYASYPALWILNGTSNLVLRLMGLPAPQHAEGKLSLEELRLVIQASFDELEGKKRDLLERVLRATDRPVRAIMVPRVDMEVLSVGDGYEKWMAKVRRFGFSRYPVSQDGDPDHVIGYVYVKDLLMAGGRERPPSIASLKRDILIVPEGQTVGEVLEQFQRTKIPIALVVDEYGGTAGLVTLEDVVTEIVGDLQDEITMGIATRIHPVKDGSLIVDGTVPIDELELSDQRIPEIEGGDTVSGYVVASLGRLASPGDVIDLGRWEMIVEDVRARRVHRVRLRRKPEPSGAERESDRPSQPSSIPPPPKDRAEDDDGA